MVMPRKKIVFAILRDGELFYHYTPGEVWALKTQRSAELWRDSWQSTFPESKWSYIKLVEVRPKE